MEQFYFSREARFWTFFFNEPLGVWQSLPWCSCVCLQLRLDEFHAFLGRSEGLPRTRITNSSYACDCGGEPVSVGAFFFLSSFFFFHPESCLKIKIVVGKSDVLGEHREGPGRGEMKKKEKIGKMIKNV